MSADESIAASSGSHWRRWDPHLHAPGTHLNDQFHGDWEGYLAAIECASPAVEVLGVTDYFSIACYREVRKRRQAGRMPGIKLLFLNVELRLDVATEKKQPINLHLLFSPEDDSHETEIERVLAGLTFEFKGRRYRCAPADLASLGRAVDRNQTDEDAARRTGANQFKVPLDQLRDLFRNDAWTRRNCIVAVSGSSNDGTAGLKNDASFTAWRKEVETFSHVVFCAAPSVREFWLGKKADLDAAFLEQEYGGRKPCLHGSDAHCVAKVAQPDERRYCWVKGDPTFESLRQVILEPEGRVWIGPEAPQRHDASSCIDRVATVSTPWLASGPVTLNPGLVAIIGPRGSGKTALADILAIGAGVTAPLGVGSSFLHRASHPINYLRTAAVELRWGDGTTEQRGLCASDADQNSDQPAGQEGVCYLSQQFVERLCSAEGLASELRREIERVIFEATGPDDRLDADSFEQLAEIHLSPIRAERQTLQEAIDAISAEVVAEDAQHERLRALSTERERLTGCVEKTRAEMVALLPQGSQKRAAYLGAVEEALTVVTTALDRQRRSRVRVTDLQKEIARLQSAAIPQLLGKLQTEFHEAGLSSKEWQALSIQFAPGVDRMLEGRLAVIDGVIQAMTHGDPDRPARPDTPLAERPQSWLVAERDRVKAEVGIDQQKQRRYESLQKNLEREQRSLQRVAADEKHAQGARDRKQALNDRRRGLHARVFQSFIDEQQKLARLYEPLHRVLEGAEGSLSRLRFSVAREVDLAAWVQAGEGLLDLRKESRLRGHGALLREAGRLLYESWRLGTADEVATGMQEFIRELLPEFRKSMPSGIDAARASEWYQQLAAWLYSTDHIKIRYSITYDGTAIEQLSPGTRGIVLLLLYLVIDRNDQRPLVIDQPEENLDPKSVFEELVPHFREARHRRQVIIVTHNANLVVNTDADQVIVASSERRDGVGLPKVSYRCGSLENPVIRQAVCDILEGGERAFLDRERRYRINRQREQ